MRRSSNVITVVILIAIAAFAVVVARRSGASDAIASSEIVAVDGSIELPILGGPAPAVESEQWLNTVALTKQDLADKVVLYDFWTFGCVNCRNTLPHVKAWHSRYAADGLIVLSIHRPEFDYERDIDAVREFIADNDVFYPVAIDNDAVNWRAFENRYWPAFYLHDRHGDRRLVHFGEGRYREIEAAIRSLLAVDPSSPWATVE